MKSKNWQNTLPPILRMLFKPLGLFGFFPNLGFNQFDLFQDSRIVGSQCLYIFKFKDYSKLKLSVTVSQSWSAVLYFLLTSTRLSIIFKKVS